ncbi:hypothetical protein M011DRAFT_466602 [Sporormia fimetaria CBS 119925]|uniref:YMC020W-like alpha/beta hydrolase domain-containing protein n=1 Tax=Sporormia fimetaria CBS 119925 TaxID=1340428 RepID=A0A6A6VF43_9PLEO|nr:hypothetical protein M011DRAFT_466602 [Sporormia fimetaria CBS 119925]
MGPRKKTKPNPKAPAAEDDKVGKDTPNPTPSGSDILRNASLNQSTKSLAPSENTTSSAASDTQTLRKRSSRNWLGGSGSWRSKAPPSVKSVKETIGVGVAGGAPSEVPSHDPKSPKPQSPASFLSKRHSSKGDAIPAAMSKFHVSSDGSVEEKKETVPDTPKASELEPVEQAPAPPSEEPPLPPQPPKEQTTETTSVFGWRSWWSRPDGYTDKKDGSEDAQATSLPEPTPSEEPDLKTKGLGATETASGDQVQDVEMKDAVGEDTTQDRNAVKKDTVEEDSAQDKDTVMKDADEPTQKEHAKPASSTSWFWSWSSAQNAQANSPPPDTVKPTEGADPKEDVVQQDSAQQVPTEPQPAAAVEESGSEAQTGPQQSNKPSGWAFWFSSKPKLEDATSEGNATKQVGELAVSDTPSQSHPEAAQFNEQISTAEEPVKEPSKPETQIQTPKRAFGSLRGRSKHKQASKSVSTDSATSSKTVTPARTSPAESPARPETAPAPQPASKAVSVTKQLPPNLLLPEFRSTYHLLQKPTYWQQIRKYFLGGESPMPHLHINPTAPRIQKAVAIGVHGFFPAPIVQRVLGQPTGTSIRFATAARKAIDDWTQARGYTAEIEQIALEGEGFIAQRVNTLWKLLLNWIDHIKAADFILIACHSQGVPVAIMLVAKLIQFGCVNAARIGVCAMAGVNLGPFIDYKTKYLGPTAAELFEFSNPKSSVSQMYVAALDEVLRYGVRILYVGSIDDQLVSLESSTFSTISHPYIYRAVFVDGRIHAPDFLTRLVGFTLKLRNLGLPDHGLIRELSPALAGSLYGGEGHSRLYDDQRVYDLAVQHALETTSLPTSNSPRTDRRPSTSASLKGFNMPLPHRADGKDPYALRVRDYEGTGTQNPFFLPWAMRGLLEEEFVRRELGEEVEELLALFEEWRPNTKQLKDVRFRLEAVRSRL